MGTYKEKMSPIIQLLLWFLAYLTFGLVDNSHYLYGWIVHNKVIYIIIALIAISITVLKKSVGYSMTLGNMWGLFLGCLIGDYIQQQSMLNITEDMSSQAQYELSKHYGVFLWFCCILVSILISLMIALVKKRRV